MTRSRKAWDNEASLHGHDAHAANLAWAAQIAPLPPLPEAPRPATQAGPAAPEQFAFTGPRPTDAGFAMQWHLNGSSAGDLDLRNVWNEASGKGVKIGVIDDGFDHRHNDLKAGYRLDLDRDFVGRDSDAYFASGNWHGTAVMGMAAGDANGSGIVGVAHNAELVGLRVGFGATGTLTHFVDALRESAKVDVANNSWGMGGVFSDNFDNPFFTGAEAALKATVDAGRGGLGTVQVFAAGNGKASGDNVNFHNFQNSIYTIAVGATDQNGKTASFSTPGAAVHLSAPGVNVITADATGNAGYVVGDAVMVNGTSFAAPAVAGLVALMLETNRDLGWRDVQEILALSARKTDAASSLWVTNRADDWNGGGMSHNSLYGFGLADAHSAVRLAETWTQQATSKTLDTVSFEARPGAALRDAGRWETSFSIKRDIVIDRVELELDLKHGWIGDLRIGLVSAEGTTSWLLDRAAGAASSLKAIAFDLTTSQFWGENAIGNWKLVVEDARAGNTGRLDWFRVNLFGDDETRNDTLVYTDDFATLGSQAARRVITDTSGRDTLNAAAVSTDSVLDLALGSRIAGHAVSYAAGTAIENAFGGDGRDQVLGNALSNLLWGGRGDDQLSGRAGADTFAFGRNSGNDRILDAEASDRVLLTDGVALLRIAGSVATLSDGATITAANGWAWQAAQFQQGDLLFA